MNREEAVIICAMLEANYQPFKDLNTAISLWANSFAEDPFELVQAALMTYMRTNPDDFRPNVGKISKEIDRILNGEQMSDMEAWELVRKAVAKSTQTGSSAYKEWKKLPEDIQTIVSVDQILRWQMLDVDTMDTVVQSNFAKSYQMVRNRAYRNRVIPNEMKEVFSLLQSKNPEYKALPEATKSDLPEQSKSIESILGSMDDEAKKYREARGITANSAYTNHVSEFLQPVTDDDVKRVERAEKKKSEWSL